MTRKIFYICSFGGCGSTMLCAALKKFGIVKHVHSRNPPNKLEYIGKENGGKSYIEWFNGIKIPENIIKNYYVIYIYRNPIDAIFSRFENPSHLEHIQSDKNVKLIDIISKSSDLYGIQEFYNNYTRTDIKRNYKIYCVKYEDIFDKQDKLSNILGIKNLNLKKNESDHKEKLHQYFEHLYEVYKDIINTMNNNDFLIIN